MSIKLINAALEEKEGGEIVLRGVLDPASLKELKIGTYQREVLPVTTLNAMMGAVKAGLTPDIILGMRGEKFLSKEDAFYLQNDVYGLQRVSSGIRMMELDTTSKPHIGALIYFNTNEKFEKAQFNALNTQGTKLSPNIILRNAKDTHETMSLLFAVCKDKQFVLFDRVTWSQRASRGELISASMLAKATGRLHSFIVTGVKGTKVTELIEGLDRITKEIGRLTTRQNVRTFWEVVDAAWGIRRVTYKDGATQLRWSFIRALAETFASHHDFWVGAKQHELHVSRDIVRKLSSFPISDPVVQSLSASGGSSSAMLRNLMVEHINKGKRTGRLRSRMIDDEDVSTSETVTSLENGDDSTA